MYENKEQLYRFVGFNWFYFFYFFGRRSTMQSDKEYSDFMSVWYNKLER